MSSYIGANCLRCGSPFEGAYYDPCPVCLKDGYNLNYETHYDLTKVKLPEPVPTSTGIYKYKELLPIENGAPTISLNEGQTPLYCLDRLGQKLGFKYLYAKDESKNPTNSHKDRMCSIIVSRALAAGAKGITVSSTGNQGAAAAAYASAAGLPCFIFTTPNVSSTMKTFMQAYGALLFVTPTMADRGIIMEKCVRELGFAPASGLCTPPIGSSFFGIDGYKTIGYEIYEQMGQQVPDWFVVPISYGDTMYGIYKGVKDLKNMGLIGSMPRFAAAEAFGPLKATLEAGSEFPVKVEATATTQTSIAVSYVTYQTVKAIKDCNGVAECSTDQESLDMQLTLARTEGLYVETASAASLVVAKKLLEQGKISPEEKIVVLLTSNGLKDPGTTADAVPKVPNINPTMDELKSALKDFYGFSL